MVSNVGITHIYFRTIKDSRCSQLSKLTHSSAVSVIVGKESAKLSVSGCSSDEYTSNSLKMVMTVLWPSS